MNRQGLVTIVIKAWNEAAHIDRAIASAWAARHEVWPRPLEIVVADGLSSDGTAERALAWSRATRSGWRSSSRSPARAAPAAAGGSPTEYTNPGTVYFSQRISVLLPPM